MAKKTVLEEAIISLNNSANKLLIDKILVTKFLKTKCDVIEKGFDRVYPYYIDLFAEELIFDSQYGVYSPKSFVKTRRKELYKFGENQKCKDKVLKVKSRAKEIENEISDNSWATIAKKFEKCRDELSDLSIDDIKPYKEKYENIVKVANKIKNKLGG